MSMLRIVRAPLLAWAWFCAPKAMVGPVFSETYPRYRMSLVVRKSFIDHSDSLVFDGRKGVLCSHPATFVHKIHHNRQKTPENASRRGYE